MKNSMKRALCMTMALLACGSVTACGGGGEGDGERTNPNASQILNVAYFNGGVSVEWLKEIELEFEAAYPDVEVSINSELKDEIKNQQLMADIANRNEDVFFTHTITYSEFVNRDLFLDITDVVKAPAAAGEETVENRMNENLRGVYNSNGSYYAVPFYTNFSGAIYDVDLFEEKGLYIAQDGGYTSGLEGQPAKSLGKDGVADTYDDGLPATFAEYKTWLNYLSKTRGITPYIWCTDDSYRTSYLDSLQIGYEGVNDYSINTTFNGTTKAGKVITPENAYEIRDSKGKQFAIEMAKEIIDNKYYHPDSTNGSITHTGAQDAFLRSRPDGKPIAMILEGGWWENEARATFKSVASKKGDKYAHGNRRFAYMPVPVYDENAESGETFLCTSGSIAVAINKATKQADLAKTFLQFTLTEHAMSTFTKHVGLSRPYSYDLEEGVYEQLTPFGQNFWDLVTSESSKIYYSTKGHEFKSVTTFFGTYEWSWGSKLNGTTYVDPYMVFLNQKSVTVADYIAGMKERYNATNYTQEYNIWLSSQN